MGEVKPRGDVILVSAIESPGLYPASWNKIRETGEGAGSIVNVGKFVEGGDRCTTPR